MKSRVPHAGPPRQRRKNRRRPIPKWLKNSELDAMARSRCLMVLSVLSGEKPVSDAIAETKISRGTYYQMETRALSAMLSALRPLGTTRPASESRELSRARKRIHELEVQIELLKMDKRRAERLLMLTRKTAAAAPVTTGRRGRPPKSALLSSIRSGKKSSPPSTAKETAIASSIPTKDGATEP